MTYFEIGMVNGLPGGADQSLRELGEQIGVQPTYGARFAQAGPNDVIHVLMSADLWQTLLPWARAVGFGAAGFIGNQLIAKFIDSKVDKKLGSIGDKIDLISENFYTLLGEIEKSKQQRGHWDFRFGFKSSEDDWFGCDRPIVGMAVNSQHIESAADAVLALAIVGDEVESQISAFLGDSQNESDKRHVSGWIAVEDDGTVSVNLKFRSTKFIDRFAKIFVSPNDFDLPSDEPNKPS